MRMIGIGLLAFVLAGAAMALSYLDIWQQGWRLAEQAVSDRRLVFETSDRAMTPGARATADVQRAGASAPLILSGVPSFQNAVFYLPRDAKARSGVLQIDVTMQVLAGVEGALRVSIGNKRRGELLLQPGQSTRSIQIQLISDDLAASKLAVSFSLQGRGSNELCDSADGLAAIVEIESSSRLRLALDGPVETTRDRFLTWGAMARIGWQDWLETPERTRRLILAAKLHHSGHDIAFRSDTEADAFGSAELSDLASGETGVATADADGKFAWPLLLAESGPNHGIRRFVRETSWRNRFELDAVHRPARASSMTLDLALGPLPPDTYWTISVTLNDRIVHIGTATWRERDYMMEIPLPAEAQFRRNTIEVTASSSHDPEGICDGGPLLIAEMRGDAKLHGGGAVFEDGLSRLLAQLARHEAVGLSLGGDLSPAEAGSAARMLATMLESGVALVPAESGRHDLVATILTGGAIDHCECGPGWILWADDEKGIQAAEFADGELQKAIQRLPLAIVIRQKRDMGSSV